MKLQSLIESMRNLSPRPLFEINFNRRDLIDQALNAPVQCGFEAEVLWLGDGDHFVDFDNLDIEELIDQHMSSYDFSRAHDKYTEWMYNNDEFLDIESTLERGRAEEEAEDYSRRADWIRSSRLEDDLREFIDNTIQAYEDAVEEGDSEDEVAELERLREFTNEEWVERYIEDLELEDQLIEWLAEDIRDNGDVAQEAVTEFQSDWPMWRWASEWYGVADFINEFEVDVSDREGGIERVADRLQEWVKEIGSFGQSVRAGEYHSHADFGKRQDFWRVEADSSIEGAGIPAEIISPAYDTPGEMLDEMAKLFEWLDDWDAETNTSTGLHVTMSMAERQDNPPNKLKMALLLGDQYLLKQFNRLGNTYTRSQFGSIMKRAERAVETGESGDLEALEEILSQGISDGKFSSINFKNHVNAENNQLIEFRIGGGSNYHQSMDRIRQAVIRYATVMQVAYDPAAYSREYAKSIFRLLNRVAPTVDSGDADHPADIVKALVKGAGFAEYLSRDWSMASEARDGALALLRSAKLAGSGGFRRKPNIREIRVFRDYMKKLGVTHSQVEALAGAMFNLVEIDEILRGWPLITGKPISFGFHKPPHVKIRVPVGKRLLVSIRTLEAVAGNSQYRPTEADFRLVSESEWRDLMRAQQEEADKLVQRWGHRDYDDFESKWDQLTNARLHDEYTLSRFRMLGVELTAEPSSLSR